MPIANQPTNLNQLNIVSFETNFTRMPGVNYFCKRVNIPGITLGSSLLSNPFANIPIEGDTLIFEDLNVEFLVDEDLQNYLEIYNWLNSIGFPEKFEDYNAQTENIKSDISIIVHTNKSNPNYQVTFKDVFPVSLSGISFDTDNTGLEPVICTVDLKYSGAFTLKKIT